MIKACSVFPRSSDHHQNHLFPVTGVMRQQSVTQAAKEKRRLSLLAWKSLYFYQCHTPHTVRICQLQLFSPTFWHRRVLHVIFPNKNLQILLTRICVMIQDETLLGLGHREEKERASESGIVLCSFRSQNNFQYFFQLFHWPFSVQQREQ